MKHTIFYLMAAVLLLTACSEGYEKSPVTIKINESVVTLKLGETATVSAIVEPAGASDVVWSSSNAQVATVNMFGGITAIAQGTASIIATTKIGRKVASCAVYVNPTPVTRVTLNKAALYLVSGNTDSLAATVFPANASNKNVTWSSSDATKVTVSQTGVVKALDWGNATITATTQDGGFTAYCLVSVTKIPVTRVTLSKSVFESYVQDTLTLVASVFPDNATNKGVTWASSNATVATVSSSGLVKIVSGTADQTAIIRATSADDPGIFADCNVKVVAYPPLAYPLFDNKLQNNAGNWSYSLTSSDFANTEQLHIGTTASIKVVYASNWGALSFGGFSTPSASFTKLVFSIYGGPGTNGKLIKAIDQDITPNPSVTVTVVEGRWTDFSFPLTSFGSPPTLTRITFQEQLFPGTVWFSRVGFDK